MAEDQRASVLERVKNQWLSAALVAFGQTVFWDEPMKSILAACLPESYPDAKFIVGTHDADYFGKCPGLETSEMFVVQERSEDTHEMWASAGEVSSLFGAEIEITRADLADAGVDLQRLKRGVPNAEELVKKATTAPGWRAVVQASGRNLTINETKTSDVLSYLLTALQTAVQETLNTIAEPTEAHQRAAADFLDVVRELGQASAEKPLPEFYHSVWKHLYGRLIGTVPGNVQFASTFGIFRFNRATCALPRFRLLNIFLDPATRQAARDAYAQAVEGSGIYSLDRFGSRALPFDLVVRGRGRGTITMCGCGRHIVVHTDPLTVITARNPVNTVDDLAAAVEDALGPDVALVGKAVALAIMIMSAFVFVLNAGGSPYVSCSRKMTQILRDSGIELPLKPVLRLTYPTWDSLKAIKSVQFNLPDWLAAAFGCRRITAADFAHRWRAVVNEQKKLIEKLAAARGPIQILEVLEDLDHPQWAQKIAKYVESQTQLLNIQRAVEDKKERAFSLRQRERVLKAEIAELQKLRGTFSKAAKRFNADTKDLSQKMPHNLARVLSEVTECALDRVKEIDDRIAEVREELARVQVAKKKITSEFRGLETGSHARTARETMARIEGEAEAARLEIASNAIKTTKVLPRCNDRPTAWWFPLVSPDGKWFEAIRKNASFAIEEM